MTKLTTERVHDLKIYPEFFSAVCTGIKRAELRKNDRDYRVGDVLHLCEFSKTTGHTGEYIDVIVTHIADVSDWLPGYVLLSIKPQENDAAPVLPKQPELVDLSQQVEILNRILNWILKELPVPTQKASAMAIRLSSVINVISDLEIPAAAQPVIPEGLLQAINRLLDNDGIRGCFDALEQHRAKTELERLLASTAQPVSEPYKSAASDIIAERQRQISEEGWTQEHDDKYNDFQLALAAAGYAQNVADYAGEYCQPHSSINWTDAPEPEAWPWSPVWWKPTNPRRDLVKAGALILAEIERMDRIAPAQESE